MGKREREAEHRAFSELLTLQEAHLLSKDELSMRSAL